MATLARPVVDRGPMTHLRRFALASAVLLAFAMGCDDTPIDNATADASVPEGSLPPEQAARVLAKVGDRAITLGDFAAVLDRMNELDRLRYKTKERRRELLQDLIDIELLVQEAKRRDVDKRPEVEEALRLVLRDAMLSKVRGEAPAPAEIPQAEVDAYYAAHKDDFTEPERRRVSAIVLTSKAEAEKALKAAQQIKSAGDWGAVYGKFVSDANKALPADLAGDLGIVGAPTDPRGSNKSVPEAVRSAVFTIADVGGVAPVLVEAEGKFYVVRLSGKTDSHTRTVKEADRAIRVKLIEQRMAEKEAALEAELRKKYPVTIDENALAGVKLPPALEGVDWSSGPSPWRKAGAGADADAGAPSEGEGVELP